MKTIKDVFKKHLPNLKCDKTLYKKIQRFRLAWSQKSDEYIGFLSSNLLGVHIVRFSANDDYMFLTDTLNIDMRSLKEDIISLPDVDKNWKIASNPVNMTIIYLMHLAIVSKDIGSYKDKLLIELFYIFNYKIMSSLIFHSFKYPADENLAMATYERLSNKFILKKVESWQALFTYRTKDITDTKSIHYDRLKRLTTDDAVIVINSLYNKIKKTFYTMYSVLMDVKENQSKILTTTLNTVTEDGEGIKAITTRPDIYVVNIKKLASNKVDFIYETLIEFVLSIYPNVGKDRLLKSIDVILEYNKKDELLEDIVSKTISKISEDSTIKLDDLLAITNLTKKYWSSKNKEIKQTRETISKLIKSNRISTTKWIINLLTISVIVYTFLRAIENKDIH